MSAQSFRRHIKKAFRENPVSFSVAIVFVGLSFLGLGIYLPLYYNEYIIKAFHNYPEPVAKEMRKALYYTNQDWRPKDALKFYKKAIEKADEIGMDPFSPEILGAKIQVAAVYERWQNFQASCDVLEIIRRDCLAWAELLGDKHWTDGKRTRVLRQAVEISVKLGELYALPHVLNRAAAEERLTWAVEFVMKEQKRRDEEGEKDGEGAWFSNDEFGATCESLAHNYEAKSQHYLSTPLFLKALELSSPKTCHSAILMNNIATSIAQQTPVPARLAPKKQPGTVPGQYKGSTLPKSPVLLPPPPGMDKEKNFPTTASPDRAVLLSYSRRWAEQARTLADSVQGEARTEECDIGCAVASHNLGEFAEMEGLIEDARKWYTEAKGLAGKIGFQEGVVNAQKGLNRLAPTIQN